MIMKKVLSVVLVVMLALAAHAQKDVTKFLGIPVDGSKQAMIQKLKAKGYKYNVTHDWLEGEFNGSDVIISIHTYNNKVWRIVVTDFDNDDETNIKIRFNKLCRQFNNNKKYVQISSGDITIPESEDISYEMLVHKKRYDTGFFQLSGTENDDPSNRVVWFMISEKYDKYRIAIFYENRCNMSDGEDL